MLYKYAINLFVVYLTLLLVAQTVGRRMMTSELERLWKEAVLRNISCGAGSLLKGLKVTTTAVGIASLRA
jgi:hypothetical protein